MKKLLILIVCSIMLTTLVACDKSTNDNNNEDVMISEQDSDDNKDVELNEKEVELLGGWNVSENLPVINDMIFDRAISNYEERLEPVCLLASQGASNSYLYLAKTPYANGKRTLLKIVVISNMDDSKPVVNSVVDFNLLNYLDGEGSTTPDGLMGGWQDNINLTSFSIDDNQKEVFKKATDGLTGVGYVPCAVLASQVVAGTNYAYLCLGTSVTEPPFTHLYILKVYNGINGTIELSNICGINVADFTG